jgi:hypothetical protein
VDEMPISLAIVVALAFVILFAAAVWGWNQRRPRSGGPFPDVPDAPVTATPLDAPGIDLPDSSLDPTAPSKRG